MNNSKAIKNLEIIEAFDDLILYFKEKGAYDQLKEEIEYYTGRKERR